MFRHSDTEHTEQDRDYYDTVRSGDDTTMTIERAKATLRQRPDSKERSRYITSVTETIPNERETFELIDTKSSTSCSIGGSFKTSNKPRVNDLGNAKNDNDFGSDCDSKSSSMLFSKLDDEEVKPERSQRRVHWETPHAHVKPNTPEIGDVIKHAELKSGEWRDDDMKENVSDDNSTSKSPEVAKILQEARREYELNSKLSSDWTSQVSQMKEASGLYEVPRLSTSQNDDDEKTSKTSDASESDSDLTPPRDVMFMPKDGTDRQKLADDIVTKYLKDYELDSQLIPERDSTPTKDSDVVLTTDDHKQSESLTPSRIPVKAKHIQSTAWSTDSHDSGTVSHSSVGLRSSIPVLSPHKTRTSASEDVFSFDDSNIPVSCKSSALIDHVIAPNNDDDTAGKKTSIPIRHGSDVEDRYRRDRSASRESRATSRDSRSSVDIEEIISRYAAKSHMNKT